MTLRRTLAHAVLVCAIASACRKEATAPAAKAQPPAKPDKVTMNFAPSISFAPFVIAKEEGFFAQENIAPSIEALEINSAMMAIASGKLDVYAGTVRPGIFNLILRGAKVAIVADKGHAEPGGCVSEAFVAPPEIVARVAKKGLRGESFAAARGGYSDYMIDLMLDENGLQRSDIQQTFVPRGGNFLDPKRMKIEAIQYLTEPNLTNALSSGLKVLKSGDEIDQNHQFSIVVFGPKLLQEKPELGHRFMRAYLRAVAQYNQGKTDRNVAIIASYTKLPPELIQRVCWQPIRADGRVDPAAMRGFFEWGRKHDYIEGDVPVSKWWDGRFVEAASSGRTR